MSTSCLRLIVVGREGGSIFCLDCSDLTSNNNESAEVKMVKLDVLFILFTQMDLPAECQNLNLSHGWPFTPTSCFHLCPPVSGEET